MKIIGVIPARYASSRFPGKPLADICGKPMLWWVYQKLELVEDFDYICVATDDKKIYDMCEKLKMNVIMTSSEHKNPTERVHEVSLKIKGELFLFIGADEPLIEVKAIKDVIRVSQNTVDFFVANAMTTIRSAPEVIDFTNIKMIANSRGDGLYTSRSPIPYPRGDLNFEYKKFVGICAFTKEALQFFVDTPQSLLEKTEECDLIRFIEHGKKIKFVDVSCRTLSVDTPKDLEIVREIIKSKIEGENQYEN